MNFEHDAWLREALRHAPDAQLGPPPSLSEMILREARAKAHRDPAPRAQPARVFAGAAALWTWLARPRVAAGLASVMLATMVGLTWRDGPVEPSPQLAQAPAAPAAAPVPTIVAETKTLPAPLSHDSAAAKPAAPKAAAPSRRPARETAAPAPVPAPAPAAPPAPAVAVVPVPEPALELQRRRDAPSVARASADNAPAGAAAGALRAAPALKSSLAESAPGPTLAALRRALASEPQRWTWQRGDAGARAIDERVEAWLAQLDAATAAHWQRVLPAQTPAMERAAPLAELRLLRDGQLLHVWRLESGSVRWTAAGIEHAAPLDPAALQALDQAAP